MSIPLKTVDLGGGSCELSEFVPADVVDDTFVSPSSVLQHEALFDHNNILNNGLSSGHLPFPYEYHYEVENDITNTTSTAFVTHMTMANAVIGGDYILSWSYSYSRNNTGSDIIVQLVDVGGVDGNPFDPTIVHYMQQEQKDSAGTSRLGGSGTNQANSTAGFIQVTLVPGTQTFNLQLASSAGTVTTSLWDARLTLMRVG